MGVANCAEQLWQWSEAVRTFMPDTWRRIVCASLPTAPFDFRSDYVIHSEVLAKFGPRIDMNATSAISLPRLSKVSNPEDRSMYRNYRTHFQMVMDSDQVIIDYFAPILNVAGKSKLELDVNFLRRSGKQVAFIAHGSDVRDIDREMTLNPFSPFKRLSGNEVNAIRARVEDNKRQFELCGGKLLYSTPDLEFDAKQLSEEAELLPVCVDRILFTWEPVNELSPRPRILLAASHPKTKTSPMILNSLQQMHDTLKIELRYVSGVSHTDLRSNLHWAEIVIDQVGFQGYGVLAAETMASGRLLITGAAIRSENNHFIGVQTDPTRIVESLGEVISGNIDIAQQVYNSRQFALIHHDGRESAAAIVRAFAKLDS